MAQQKVALSAGDTFQGRETFGIFSFKNNVLSSSPSLRLLSSVTGDFDGVKRQLMMSRFFPVYDFSFWESELS